MNTKEKLKKISESNGGIITNDIAKKNKISRTILALECNKGSILRITNGQYIMPEDLEDELYSLSLRSSNIIFSHETALWLLGISNRTPSFHSVTSPTGRAPSESIRNSVKVYYVSKDKYEIGIDYIKTQFGNLVPCYNLERTICDCFRSRNRIDNDTFLYAIKEYVKLSKKNLNNLYEYSKIFRVEKKVKEYLEVLL